MKPQLFLILGALLIQSSALAQYSIQFKYDGEAREYLDRLEFRLFESYGVNPLTHRSDCSDEDVYDLNHDSHFEYANFLLSSEITLLNRNGYKSIEYGTKDICRNIYNRDYSIKMKCEGRVEYYQASESTPQNPQGISFGKVKCVGTSDSLKVIDKLEISIDNVFTQSPSQATVKKRNELRPLNQ
jgi:hypothetical protein